MDDYLFKKTPFNGYKREDVVEFIKENDMFWRERENEYLEKQADLSERISALEKEIQAAKARNNDLQNALSKKETEIAGLKAKTAELENENASLKSDEKIYGEIIENVDSLIDEVKTEAEKIKQQASKKASEIIAEAKKERDFAQSKAADRKSDTASILERIAQIKKSIINK